MRKESVWRFRIMARVGDAFMEYGGLGACRRSLWVQRTPFRNNRKALFRRRSWFFFWRTECRGKRVL
jgi:hypothetical protein